VLDLLEFTAFCPPLQHHTPGEVHRRHSFRLLTSNGVATSMNGIITISSPFSVLDP
jgi:hypothetical protein